MRSSLLDFISAHSREDSIDKIFYDAIVSDGEDLKDYESSIIPPSPYCMLRYEYGALLRQYCIENSEITARFHYKDWDTLIQEDDWQERLDWIQKNRQNLVELGFSGLYLKQVIDERDKIDTRWHLAYHYGGNALARAILTDKLDWLQDMYQKELEEDKVLKIVK